MRDQETFSVDRSLIASANTMLLFDIKTGCPNKLSGTLRMQNRSFVRSKLSQLFLVASIVAATLSRRCGVGLSRKAGREFLDIGNERPP